MNKQVLLASRPQGAVTEQNFRIVDAPAAKPRQGEVLVKNEWLSLDPYMRGRMNDVKSYVPPAQIDEVMVGRTVGEVVESKNPSFAAGDKVVDAARLAALRRCGGFGVCASRRRSACRPRPISASSACPASPRGSA